MARSYWKGGIKVGPVTPSVKAYALTRDAPSGFKSLCPCHGEPIRAPWVCATDGKEVARQDTSKGVENAAGAWVKVDTQLLKAAPKTEVFEPTEFVPLASLPIHLATGVYRLTPERKGDTPGVNLLWHTLNSMDVAAVGSWTGRAGSPDVIGAVFAAPDGLTLVGLPHVESDPDAPASDAPASAVVEQERSLLEQFISTLYGVKPFDRTQHDSAFLAAKQKAVDAALAGTPIEATAVAATPDPAVPDLMAALQASLDAVKSAEPKEPIAA